MPNSSIFIFSMLRALYDLISQYFLFLNKFGIISTFGVLPDKMKSDKLSKINVFTVN